MSVVRTQGLVSVVVASYNHAGHLDRRMASLISQTYQNIEILVIDDHSPDNSLEVLRKYESHPKVKLVARHDNGGWVAVFNQGIEMASGEFVLFANCDDECDPSMIERLVAGVRAFPSAGISFCRSLLIDKDGKHLGDDYSMRESAFRLRCEGDTLIDQSEMGRFLLHSCVIPNTSAALIRRECFDTVGLISAAYRVCSDWDLYFKIATCYDVAYLAAPLNRFRQHPTSITGSAKGRLIHEEYVRLLLGKIRSLELTRTERARYRTRVMYLWTVHLLAPTLGGLGDFNHHLKVVANSDKVALLYLPVAIVQRIGELIAKARQKLFRLTLPGA